MSAGAGTGTMGGTGGTSAGGTTTIETGGTTQGGSAGAASGSGPGGGSGGAAPAAGTGAGPQAGAQGASGANGTSAVVLDDVDHNDTELALPEGSAAFGWLYGFGNWFVTAPAPDPYYRDATAADIVPPRGDSTKAYRVADEGRESGVDLWAQLHHPGGEALDLSAFAGITFWAKLEGSEQLKFGVNPGVSYFAAPSEVPTRTLAVSNEWRQFSLRFSELGADVHAIASFDFIVGEGGDKFDLWVDDLGLFCDEECPQPN